MFLICPAGTSNFSFGGASPAAGPGPAMFGANANSVPAFGANTGDCSLLVLQTHQLAGPKQLRINSAISATPYLRNWPGIGREYLWPQQNPSPSNAHAALLIMLSIKICIDKLNTPVLPTSEEPDRLVQLTQTTNQEMR